MQKFQVAQIFVESFRFVASEWRALIMIAAIPLALTIAANIYFETAHGDDLALMMDQLMRDMSAGAASPDAIAGQAQDIATVFGLMQIVDFAIVVPFAVAWFRYTLLGPGRQPPRPGYALGLREFRFLGYAALSALLAIAAVLVIVFAASLAIGAGGAMSSLFLLLIVAAIVAGLIAARMSFLFPAVAVDAPAGVRRAWAQTRGLGWRLLGLGLMIYLPFVIASTVVGMLAAALFGFLIAAAVVDALQYVMTAVIITAVALAFWKTTGLRGPARGAST